MMIPGFVTIIVIEVSYVCQKKIRSAQNVTDVSFFVVITGKSDLLVYLKYTGQVMLDGFKGDKYLVRGGCLASCQMVGIRLEMLRVMMVRWLSGSGKEI